MKNILELNKSEKNRIINMHIHATKRQYLNEQQVIQGGAGDPYQYRKTGDKLEFAKKGTNTWQEPKTPKAITAINNLFLKQTNQQTKTSDNTNANTGTTQPQNTTQTTNQTLDSSSQTQPTQTTGQTQTQPTQTQPTQTTGQTQPTATTGQTQPATNEQTLVDKIKQKCGPIWTSFEGRVKGYESEMSSGINFSQQKQVARKMKRDEDRTFRFCYKQYGDTSLLPTEKEQFNKLASGWSKFLETTWKVTAPVLTKMMTSVVDKAGEAASKQVIKSLNIESFRHKNYTDEIINEIIRKNLKNL